MQAHVGPDLNLHTLLSSMPSMPLSAREGIKFATSSTVEQCSAKSFRPKKMRFLSLSKYYVV